MTRQSDWIDQAACRDADPNTFTVANTGLSTTNRTALSVCSTCPVRVECRDSYLDMGRQRSIIAGGWWWNSRGKAHPHPADVGAAAAAAPQGKPTKPRINQHVRATRKAITAGRAKLADPGLTYKVAARRYGTNFRAVCDAVFIGRHAPDLLRPVWDGRRTLASAFSEANSRRHNSSRQPEGSADTTPQAGQSAA